LRPGYPCPIDVLEWTDENNNKKQLDCFHKTGPLEGKNKGLKYLAIELGFQIRNERVDEIREIVSKHPAFSVQSKLEILAKQYGVKIIFCPKFHCELNPIKGLFLLMRIKITHFWLH
jgi:hypothetical protein